MGDCEVPALAGAESSVKYHPYCIKILTSSCETSRGTLPDGEFDWGGFLLKYNGGAQRLPQDGWQSSLECKGIRELNCDTDRWNRYESRT